MGLIIQRSILEDDVISGCRKNKSEAQRFLFEKHSPKMLGVCQRYIKDTSEAEDVMVGGFVKVFSKIRQFKGEGSLEGWIRRIMINEALIYLRKHRHMYLEVDIQDIEHEPEYALLENNLEAEDVLDIVQKLPEGYRTVFNLFAVEGYSHKEIAEILGINVNTSKSQLSRARKLLQKFLMEREVWEKENIRNYEKLQI